VDVAAAKAVIVVVLLAVREVRLGMTLRRSTMQEAELVLIPMEQPVAEVALVQLGTQAGLTT
jgi:hypothetical protein